MATQNDATVLPDSTQQAAQKRVSRKPKSKRVRKPVKPKVVHEFSHVGRTVLKKFLLENPHCHTFNFPHIPKKDKNWYKTLYSFNREKIEYESLAQVPASTTTLDELDNPETDSLQFLKQLGREQNWIVKKAIEIKRMYTLLVLDELESIIGKNKLKANQVICLVYKRCTPQDVPATLKGCEERLKNLYINIWDFINGIDIDFPTIGRLYKYTYGLLNGQPLKRVFPLNDAKERPLLKVLLCDFASYLRSIHQRRR